jgi:hypothetical protein
MRVRWSVYLERSNSHGPLPPLRMLCKDQAEAERELSKPAATAISREEVWARGEERPEFEEH